MEIDRQTAYEGPTWLDQAVVAKCRPEPDVAGFGAELRAAFAGRLRWLSQRQLVETAEIADDVVPEPDMMRSLRQLETKRLVASLSREFGATDAPHGIGTRINGIYDAAHRHADREAGAHPSRRHLLAFAMDAHAGADARTGGDWGSWPFTRDLDH